MIKTLAKSVREYKKLAILAPCAVSLEVIMEVLIPLLMANLIDNGIYAGSMTAIYKTGLMLVMAAFLSLAFGAIAGIFASKATSGFAKNLRHDLYSAVQKYSFSNIDKFSTASIITRLTTDVTYVKQSFQMIIRIAVRAPLMLAFSLIMAIRINAKLSLIFLCLIPFIATGLILIFRKVHPIFGSVFKRYDDLNNVVEENVSGIRVVKSFVLEDEETEKFTAVSNEIYQKFTHAERIMALSSPLMQFGIYVAIILISWFGAKIIINSGMTELTTGELTSLITYAVQVLASLMMLSMIFVMITISKASAERITEILKEVPTIENPNKPVMSIKNGDVEFQNLSFSYVGKKEKECLKNINLKIKSGETIGIIGGTGSGKSTLVNLIPRLYDATEGTVKVSDLDVKKYDLNVLRDAVSMVLQKNVLFSGTIKENLRWGNKEATDEDLKRACKLARIDDFIEELPNKYDTVIEQGGTNFSGGQKQRICIARALLKKPKILILDDSTSAVDTKTDSLIRKSFREEIPDVTKIIVAQRIASVQDADKIIVMEDGKINGFGTHEELMKTNEIYREVFESQTSNK